MKKIVIILLAAALALVALSGLAESVSEQTTRTLSILSCEGDATVSKGGKKAFPAAAGMSLRAGYTLFTGEDGMIYFSVDGDKLLRLAPRSSVVISSADDKLVLTVAYGEMFFNVTQPQPEGAMTVEAGGASMGVRGTSGSLQILLDVIRCGLFDGKVALNLNQVETLIGEMEQGDAGETAQEMTKENSSLFALLSAMEETGTVKLPEGFYDDAYVQSLAAQWETMQQQALTEGIEPENSRYLTDAQIAKLAFDALIKNASYENLYQKNAADQAAAVAYVKGVAEQAVGDAQIVVSVNVIEYDAPNAGDADEPEGFNGLLDFSVTVAKNEATLTTEKNRIYVFANRFNGVSNQEAVDASKAEALNALPQSAAQAVVSYDNVVSETAVQEHILAAARGALSDKDVTVAIHCRFDPEPKAGDADNPAGTDGAYFYQLTFTKGIRSATTEEQKLSIPATPYAGQTSQEAVDAAAEKAPGALPGSAPQAGFMTDGAISEAAVQNFLLSAAREIAADEGMTVTIHCRFDPEPVAGDADNPAGTDGAYLYQLTFTKGERSATTDEQRLVITAAPFAGKTNEACVKEALALLKAAAYGPAQQASVNDAAAAQAFVLSIAKSVLPNTEVTLSVTGDFTAAVAENADREGTNGKYDFTFYCKKGLYEESAAGPGTAIAYTPYDGMYNDDAIALAKSMFEGGKIEVDYDTPKSGRESRVRSMLLEDLSADTRTREIALTVSEPEGSLDLIPYSVTLSLGKATGSASVDFTVTERIDPRITAALNAVNNYTFTQGMDIDAVVRSLVPSPLTCGRSQATSLPPQDGTSLNPAGTAGSYRFVYYISNDRQTSLTNECSYSIPAKTYNDVLAEEALSKLSTLSTISLAHADSFDVASLQAAVKASINELLRAPGITVNSASVSGSEYAGVTISFTADCGASEISAAHRSASYHVSYNVGDDLRADAAIAKAAAAIGSPTLSYAEVEANSIGASAISGYEYQAQQAVNTLADARGLYVTVTESGFTAPVTGTSADPKGTNGIATLSILLDSENLFGTKRIAGAYPDVTITAKTYAEVCQETLDEIVAGINIDVSDTLDGVVASLSDYCHGRVNTLIGNAFNGYTENHTISITEQSLDERGPIVYVCSVMLTYGPASDPAFATIPSYTLTLTGGGAPTVPDTTAPQ